MADNETISFTPSAVGAGVQYLRPAERPADSAYDSGHERLGDIFSWGPPVSPGMSTRMNKR